MFGSPAQKAKAVKIVGDVWFYVHPAAWEGRDIEIVRAFVRLREIFARHKDLANKLETLERKYAAQFKVVFDAIRQPMAAPEPKKRKIGF